MDYRTITYDRYGTDGRIGRITLNRPEKLNALSEELLSELEEMSWGTLRALPNCKLGTFRKLSAEEVQVVRDVERGRVEPVQPMRPDRVEIGVVNEEAEEPES